MMEEGTAPDAPVSPSIEDLAPLFPAYHFERFIAEGGMGAVYLARQISLDRPVAIKILARELSEDPVFRASFEAEAKAMARLNHPNLIGVYDFGEVDGMLFIVMEMVDGNSLHESAYGRTIDPVQAASIVSAISRGLEHAHHAGILHRDIKPGNILLDAEGHPKIGDFGLAEPMGRRSSEDELIYGTPGYTAPEVYERKGDYRSDIFSVGILLHELLTGRLPDGSSTPPSMLCGCSHGFDAIFARATNPNPLARYASAGELADELDRAAKAADAVNASTNRLVLPKAAVAPVIGAKRIAPAVGASAQARTQGKALAQMQSSRSSSLFIIVSLCVLVGIGLVVMLASRGSKRRGDEKGAAPSLSELADEIAETGADVEVITPVADDPEKSGGEQPNRQDQPGAGTGSSTESPGTPSQRGRLEVLRDKLVAGSRDEFPPGTVAQGGSHFLLVAEAMGWWQAKEFAEGYGAHLALLPSAADRRWFSEQFPTEAPVWIGAGMASDDQWQWLDGSPLEAVAADPGRRSLSLGVGGALQAEASREKFQVALQWNDDGSNPATTGAQLKRTAETITARGAEDAIYPVGTRSYPPLKSHFFIVQKATSWEKARELAKLAGGSLAVPSSKAESDWIRASFGDGLEQGTTLWLGGFRQQPGEPWAWLTGEAWNYAKGWLGGVAPAAGEASNGRMMLKLGADGSGWVANDGAEGAASGLLIEWGPPKKQPAVTAFDLDSWMEKTDATFRGRVQADIDHYNKGRSLMVDRYIRTIERLGRKHIGAIAGQEGAEKDRIREAVEDAVREVEKSGALLVEVPKSAPEDFHDLQTKTEKGQEVLIAEFQEKLSTQVNVYTRGVIKQADQLSEDGYSEAAVALKARTETIGGKGPAFLKVLGLEDPTISSTAAAE